MRHKKRVIGAVAFAASVLVATPAAADPGQERAALERTRRLFDRFRSVETAAQAGFLATDECVAAPGLGGMGYHYVNPARFDAVLDPRKPEALLYEAKANGGLRLAGVEYLVVDADQDLATDDDRPVLAGVPFDGPMPGHGPGMPIHYDLHVWAWTPNPAGRFAAWNSNVTCP